MNTISSGLITLKNLCFLFQEGSAIINFFDFLSTVTSKKTHMLNAFDAI